MNCTAWVTSWSATHATRSASSTSSARGGLAQVRRDEQQALGRRGVEQDELVLAEHALGEVADEAADLGAEQHAADRPQRSGARARLAELGARAAA